jgi:molybdopterin synthase catalytic subunit
MLSFALSEQTLVPAQLSALLRDESCGALVTFEGWVRNFNEGKHVVRLDYEAYPELVATESQKILLEAVALFECKSILSVHRVGQLSIADIAVWIGVVSVHRENAFKACQYVIDNLKLRLPIWKKEHYLNDETSWVNCEGCQKPAHQHRILA